MLIAAIVVVKRFLFVSLWLGGGLCVAQAQAGFTVDWFKVAGGGGTSDGGQYSIISTIGQHDAGGSLTGGNYALTGGFWSIYTLQTPGAPILAVTLTNSNVVVISWSLSSATNFVLLQNSDLTTTDWMPSDYPITTNGDTESITITSPPPGYLFFRLSHP